MFLGGLGGGGDNGGACDHFQFLFAYCLRDAVDSLQFSHVSHVHLQLLSVMSVMSACIRPFQFSQFSPFPKNIYFQFSRNLLLGILLGEVFPFNTSPQRRSFRTIQEIPFSLRFNNMWHFARLSDSIYVSSRYTMDQWGGDS